MISLRSYILFCLSLAKKVQGVGKWPITHVTRTFLLAVFWAGSSLGKGIIIRTNIHRGL